MPPKSEKRKPASGKGHDRISGLPNLIIGEILSLLSTKQAVATSILSTRWRYLWTSVTNLEFHCWDKKKEATVVKFVDRVLSKCTAKELRRFHLNTSCCHSHVHRWINKAIIRNVQILELHVRELPVETLLNIPDSFCLPKLKELCVSVTHESIAQKLVSSCPVLEDLYLQGVYIKSTFVISPPHLKRLRLRISTRSFSSHDKECKLEIDAPRLGSLYVKCFNEKEIKFVIDAPQLKILNIYSKGHVPCVILKNVASEVEAIIKVGDRKREASDKETRFIVDLITQLSGAKSLTLDTSSLIGPGNADLNMLPIFNNMTLLKLKMGLYYGLQIISDLLQASPSLEVLIFTREDEFDEEESEVEEEEELEEVEFHWIEPQHVPPCLSSCLRIFEFHTHFNNYYTVVKQELEMIKYLLGNGDLLQKVVAEANGVVENGDEFYEELLKFPRASRHCEVHLK